MNKMTYNVYIDRINSTVPMQHIITRNQENWSSTIVAGFGHIAIVSPMTGVNPIYLLQIKRIEDIRNFVNIFIKDEVDNLDRTSFDERQCNIIDSILDAIGF